MRGYDAGQKVAGRKRHILVDTLGLILLVWVHPANVQDRAGTRLRLATLRRRFGWLRCIWADGAGALVSWVRAMRPSRGTRLEIIKHGTKLSHYKLLPRRQVVERTFAWLGRCRRPAGPRGERKLGPDARINTRDACAPRTAQTLLFG